MAEEEKKEKKGLIKEFKEFISRGNVLDMAVGVIIATAFGKITTSLVNDVIMPAIGLLCGGRDLTDILNWVIVPATLDEAGEVVDAGVTLGFGTFIGTIIDFILVALVVFLIVKAFNKAREAAEKRKKQEEAVEEEPAGPTSEELLTEIRDLLAKQNKGE
ncbi:MAG: large-conductance mechanosensitive channel protein MscL [Oscillospiraceae bacterium]|nr:large-conductance mechanosensitive channel protein MscL [Oscillospiraceae bacterium]